MRVFDHQVPGGTISNLVTQLEEQKALYRLGEVLEEIPRVREELGYPPLVTPTSQIVGTQAVLNVLTGERYKLVPGEVRDYMQGYYGRPPAPVNQEIARKVLGDRAPISGRPADLLEPKMEKLRNELIGLVSSEEDIISYALFPQVARRFFEFRRSGKYQEEEPSPKKEILPKQENVLPAVQEKAVIKEKASITVKEKVPPRKAAGETERPGADKEVDEMNLSDVKDLIKFVDETDISEVSLESAGVKLAIRKGRFSASETSAAGYVPQARLTQQESAEPSAPAPARVKGEDMSGLKPITAPMVGTYYNAPSPESPPFVKIGDRIKKGQTLCIIEAMKLMNEIKSEFDGELVDIKVDKGHPVEYGQVIFLIKE
jgi:oxaloacetate decarboxylase alpha subunit